MSCPSLDELLESFHPPTGGPTARPVGQRPALDERIREHLATGCPACARRVRQIEALAAGPLPPVPPVARKTALRALARRLAADERARRRGAGAAGGVLDLVARLVFDSLGQAPAVALRGNAAPLCHLLYEAGPFEVDVALLRNGSLVGQLVEPEGGTAGRSDVPAGAARDDWSLTECKLVGEDRHLFTGLEETGEFRFQGVGPGQYELLVESVEFRVQVPRFELGSSGERSSREDRT